MLLLLLLLLLLIITVPLATKTGRTVAKHVSALAGDLLSTLLQNPTRPGFLNDDLYVEAYVSLQ